VSLILVFVVLLFLQSLVSRRLERTVLTAPIVFASAGMLAALVTPELAHAPADRELFLKVAEIGLVLLLFTDASRTDLGVLRSIRNLPTRLLSVGMLSTILLGSVAAKLLFPALSVWEAGMLGAILAPTDAGLGQVIVSSPRVPLSIRQALNVEAGLNDGLSVPFLLFFMAMASQGAESESKRLVGFIVEQLGYGALIGAGIGLAGGWLLHLVQKREWMAHAWRQLGVVALPLLCLLASEHFGASMFIAAFVAGLAVQLRFAEAEESSVEFTESWGQIFNLAVFFLFGLLAVRALAELNTRHVAYAVLSLTVVRMLPVAIALVGARLSRATVLFMGWFGPRGLASIVLGLVYLEERMGGSGETIIRLAVTATVLLSIFAHGLSAQPGIGLYARRVEALPPGAPELDGVPAPGEAG